MKIYKEVKLRLINFWEVKSNLIIPSTLILTLVLLGSCANSKYELPEVVDFNYHIKPILSDRCFTCHGPDENSLEADLHLNTPEGAFHKLLESGGHALVPGSLAKSEAYQRLTSNDLDFKMPPPEKTELVLSDREIAMLGKWIKQGAKYKSHWAFAPPQKPDLPKVKDRKWSRNPIDQFVLKKLEELNKKPNEEASLEILLRRVSLDLTGLPPTLKEIDNFLDDKEPGAFERVVDRLLASDQYGERMALEWMDVARFADTHGYSTDGSRVMWPWRDWVIKAFNENKRYDQFIVEQVAGDKIPNATRAQQLATGFLRNQKMNAEGGIILEEYLLEYAAERTETVSTAFLGLTMQCAKCHDHKYDPISQKDYYQFMGFFNNVNERGIVQNDGNSGPQVELTNKEVEETLAFIDKKIDEEKTKLEFLESQVKSSLLSPIVDLKKELLVDVNFDYKKDNAFTNSRSNEKINTSGDVKLEKHEQGHAARITAYDLMNLKNEKLNFTRADAFSFSFSLKLEQESDYLPILKKVGGKNNSYQGYEIALIEGHPTIRIIYALPANMIEVRIPQPLKINSWAHYTFSYDGTSKADGINIYQNGDEIEGQIVWDKLTKPIFSANVLTIGGRTDYQVSTKGVAVIDNLKIYKRILSPWEAMALSGRHAKLNNSGDKSLIKHYLRRKNKKYAKIEGDIKSLYVQKNKAMDTIPGVMVMGDLMMPRKTFILERGVYDKKGEAVNPATPAIFWESESISKPKDRLEMANWLVQKDHPLTARVAVNRYWQMYFGRGLVNTPEDFGNQGALPSHPDLLDWLACHFVESGWDVKELQKLIVMSATYQQSSSVDKEERTFDPENIWLSRGPSFRLQAELIRDCALATSGLLSTSIGGESGKPYQPEGLWAEKSNFSALRSYQMDEGEQSYRRGLYTFWRRTSPPPAMITFDAPTRDVCTVKRERTNTPLQALVLLNDPQFVEASRVLAENIVKNSSDLESKIVEAYRTLTSLNPSREVLNLLLNMHEDQKEIFAKDSTLAKEYLEIGQSPFDESLSKEEVATMGVICNTILSFDETIIKR